MRRSCRTGSWRGALSGLLATLVLTLPGCDPDITEGDLVVDNRTDVALTVVLLTATGPPAGDATLSVVGSGREQTIAGMDGCSQGGFEARTAEGEVVASLPPSEPDSADCRFTWVIEEDGSRIAR